MRIVVQLQVLLGMLLSVPVCAWSQAAAIENVRPTVTAEMGDVGGKIFGKEPEPGKTRRYYIAAEPQLWDYAPAGRDVICGKPLPPAVLGQRQVAKVRYVEYTDATFATRVMQPQRLGILGPVLRGVQGEYLAITFLNRCSEPLSMHPHGVKYDKDSEGAFYEPKPGLGSAVGPGAKFTYVWHLDESSGPRPEEPSSKAWLYHSHVNGDDEINLGLVGFIVVTDPKRARPDGTPVDVDRELATLYFIFDESGLGAAEREVAEYANLPGGGPKPKTWTQIQEMTEQGSRYAINGLVFGNLNLEMIEGERTRWYLFGLGSERDFHTAHWHGLRVLHEGRRTDIVELLPASMKVADLVADNPGSWMLHCHVAEHMMEGMFARMMVHPKSSTVSNRIDEPSFFGLPHDRESLRITSAEARINAPGQTNACELNFRGVITVYDAFSVFAQPIRIQLGDKAVLLQPDRKGKAQTDGNRFEVKNASEYGVVYGGLMEFQATLSGAEWLDVLKKVDPAIKSPGKSELQIPVTVAIDNSKHTAVARFLSRP
jgi:FtsP/CotA-like multicopper oxidase with cupredoxin domain